MATNGFLEKEKLTAICDSIRAKTGSTGLIPIDDIPQAIANIQTPGVKVDGTTIKVDTDSYERIEVGQDGDDETGTVLIVGGAVNVELADDDSSVTVENLEPANIKKDVTILGVTGELEAGGEDMLQILINSKPDYCNNLFKNYKGVDFACFNKLDVSKITNADSFFEGCENLEYIPNLVFSSVTNMRAMFKNCTKLKEIPEINNASSTNLYDTFYYCQAIKTIPTIDASNCTNMQNFVRGCISLESIPEMNTSKVSIFSYAFNTCAHLQTIEKLDLSSVSSSIEMFNYCEALTNLYLYNISRSLQIGSGTDWGHLLTIDSLVHICKECIKGSSSRTLTIGIANLEKIANVYVKPATDDEFTIAVGEKGDVVVCESTDDNAMTLTAYMTLKNWTLA